MKTSKGKNKHQNYEPEALENALVDVVRKKMSFRKASLKYGVPVSTIGDHMNKRVGSTKPGPRRMLSDGDEKALVEQIQYMESIGEPLTRKDIKKTVIDIVQRSGQTDKMLFNMETGPSDKWLRVFYARHPELTQKGSASKSKAEGRKHQRGHDTVLQDSTCPLCKGTGHCRTHIPNAIQVQAEVHRSNEDQVSAAEFHSLKKEVEALKEEVRLLKQASLTMSSPAMHSHGNSDISIQVLEKAEPVAKKICRGRASNKS